jgi:Uma2 family endonuclease
MSPATAAADPMNRLYRFTVDQYHRMLEADLPLGKYDVELIRGLIVYKGRDRGGRPIPYRFTVEEYLRLIELGIFREGDKVELIRGEVVAKMTQGDPHGLAVENLYPLLLDLVRGTHTVRCQSPVVFPESAPEPDFVVCLPPARRGNTHPRPAHVFVVVEVADSSLPDDRGDRLQLYAEAGIPVYWIVNLVDRQVEVYADPVTPPGGEPRYQSQSNYTTGQQVPLVVAGTAVGSIPVDAILP